MQHDTDIMVYTSYFDNLRRIEKNATGPMVFFSIAGKTPAWFLSEKIKNHKKLSVFAPKFSWWREWHNKFSDNLDSKESIDFYREKYEKTVLSDINMQYLHNELTNCGGIPVLLCFETPDKFCHRQLVCEFLNKHEIKCKEWSK